ncbi:stage VI sporulation protein D [Alkalihalobacillus sp. MEB130]|uniref:stage VI sporulation protein D n=1 Tax=Alkalihalobacillus sp. MEB130 TaxID=2976704 RepID=UPI0028DD4652|nr:stage VI sporulation protein D [Alkalihalobacillus sp. MEB130]MDT8859503.1 stage VI sporulation protein D [Alkalihalobacillus sp. MEB130]
MTQEHPSKLSFSIEESVWLNKGQEVEEILGMSLEPEIVIEEKDHHVFIRGGLRLVGEYRPTGTDDSKADNSQTLEQQVSFRSAGDVTIAADGSGQIKHFFPIDVTIPLSRIQNLDDVYVEVDSFDYDLPEKSCIQLTADISISGMTQQQETYEKRIEKEIEKAAAAKAEVSEEEEQVPTAFSFEAKKRPEPELARQEPVVQKEEIEEPVSYTPPSAPKPASPAQTSASSPIHSFYQPEEKKPAWAGSPSSRMYAQQEEEEPTLTSYDSRKEVELEATSEREEVARLEEVEEDATESTEPVYEEIESVEEEVEEIVEEVREAPAQPETKINLAPLKEIATEPVAEDRPEADAEGDAEVEAKAPTPREENALYLTKMLSKGEERFSKWRMCIIQENESLDTIADRYEISTSQIIRMNRLQGEQVEEGQILYIPVSVESK